MLLIPGHNPAGNVLHVIIGPESELYCDLHGMQVADITEMLSLFNANEPVHLQLTRTSSERVTAAGLIAMGGADIIKTTAPGKQGTEKAPRKSAACSYCGQNVPLVPVTGVRVCEQCLQIELGLKAQKKKESAG